MDFVVSKSELITALAQILQGRNEDSKDVIDLTVNDSTLTVVITGRSIEIDAEAQKAGRAVIPSHVIFRVQRMLETYSDRSIRMQISKGKLQMQKNSISDPGIAMKKMGRRPVDIPDDAPLIDILALPIILSQGEIKKSDLQTRVQEAEHKFKDDIYNASKTLEAYGFSRNELENLARLKIAANAKVLKRSLATTE